MSNNGNGNGHTPPFRLAPVETPEQEARNEVLREIAPKIRRRVREDGRLSAGAKFFFYALLDDAFWHAVGGHGTGQIYADIRTLALRYGHDEKTVGRWKEELEDAGWLWTNYEWPMTEWRLTPLMPPPVNAPAKRAVQMALGRATRPVGEAPDTLPNGARGVKPAKNEGTPGDNGRNGHRPPPKCPTPVGGTPDARGRNAPKVVGKMPTSDRHNAHDLRAKRPRASGEMPTSDRHNAHDQKASRPSSTAVDARPPGSNGHGEKSLGEGRKGELEGGAAGQGTPPAASPLEKELREWADSLKGEFRSKLLKQRERIVAQLRGASPNQKPLLKFKLQILDAKIDGPAPPPAERAAPAPPPAEDKAEREAVAKIVAAEMRKAREAIR